MLQQEHISLAIVFVAALVTALVLSPVMGKLGRLAGFVDKPRPGEVQKRPTPRSGGYAIFIAFWVAVGLSLVLFSHHDQEQHRLLGVLIGSAVVLPIALIDDALRLAPRPQLIGQIVVALIPIGFGVVIDSVANPFGGVFPLATFIAIPLTLFWFVGMINTLNFIDTMDGMAGGVTCIAALILFVRAVTLEQYTIAALMVGLMGACLGFLPYNLPTARLFMGTSGSMFLGYSLAMLALIGGAKIATTLMVLSIPILDTALVIATRSLHGRSPFKGGDAAHFPHRMLALGLTPWRVLLASYALCLLLGYLALSLTAVQKLAALLAMGVIVVVIVGAIAYRTHHKVSARAEDAAQSSNKQQ